ncbi:hypothetical protein KQX54_021062 [Cotesia glomerata]|uniref:Uncharacterized protein n=1 Tax=Cotesia glomerata TaxID=32391 RepID=A0AAV7J9M3_COTGL|nr:hypothetical protein KQX54_021062 [Cotesia glomerata]
MTRVSEKFALLLVRKKAFLCLGSSNATIEPCCVHVGWEIQPAHWTVEIPLAMLDRTTEVKLPVATIQWHCSHARDTMTKLGTSAIAISSNESLSKQYQDTQIQDLRSEIVDIFIFLIYIECR